MFRVSSLALLGLVFLTACTPTTSQSINTSAVAAMERAAPISDASAVNAPMTTTAVSPPPAQTHPADDSDIPGINDTKFGDEDPVVAKGTPVPPDNLMYQANIDEVKKALTTGKPGRLIGLPTGFAHGYPIYPATCMFGPENAVCTDEAGQVVTEDYLVAHTSVIRNSDVLALGLRCGKVCVDEQDNVLGYVSPDMVAWRDQNCTWANYGTPKCK